jgi:hypothetical protein
MIRAACVLVLGLLFIAPPPVLAATLTADTARTMIRQAKQKLEAGDTLTDAEIVAALKGRKFLGRSLDSPTVARLNYRTKTYTSSYRGVTGTAQWKVLKGKFCYRWPAMKGFICTSVARVRGGFVLIRPKRIREAVALRPVGTVSVPASSAAPARAGEQP